MFFQNIVNEIENSKKLPSIPSLLKICEYFSITTRDFFNEEISDDYNFSEINENLKKLSSKQFESINLIIKDLSKNYEISINPNNSIDNNISNCPILETINYLKTLDDEQIKSICSLIKSFKK